MQAAGQIPESRSGSRYWPAGLIAELGTTGTGSGSDGSCRIFAISGPPGSGKTTLARDVARADGGAVAVVSLDDFYCDAAERNELARRIHPWLSRRGVPGTHRLDRLVRVLSAIRAGQPVRWPAFDKTRDMPVENGRSWPGGTPRRILVEGWCLGCRTLSPGGDRPSTWLDYLNRAIIEYRRRLFWRFEGLWFLRAPDIHTVRAWRYEQEIRRVVPLSRLNRLQVNRLLEPMVPIIQDMLVRPPHPARVVELDAYRRCRRLFGP